MRISDWSSVCSSDLFAALWPIGRFPVLVDAGRTIVEASTIIEYLGLHHPGPVPLLPADPRAALEVRGMDRYFDNYISTPQHKVVFASLRPQADRDARRVANARDPQSVVEGKGVAGRGSHYGDRHK